MFRTVSRRIVGSSVFVGGAFAGVQASSASSDTSGTLSEILQGVKDIKSDLGITTSAAVDPIGNAPYVTDKHGSFSAKALKAKPELYQKYANVKTPMGFTFDQAIQAGLDAPHLKCGIVATDGGAYESYKDIFDIVLEGWHGYKPTDKNHVSDLDYTKIVLTEAQEAKFNKYVISTRIRAGRSIDNIALPPATDRKQRRLVEKLLSDALAALGGQLSGKYYPLDGLTKDEEAFLRDNGFLFQKPSPKNVLSNCGASRDWPDARGIFHNKEKTFLVWVNEEDHIRCISMQDGGNVKEVFARFVDAINALEGSLSNSGYHYAHSERLGYLSTCPSNIGTGLRASVMLKLPKLYKKWGVHKLEEYCDSIGLQARGARGENSPPGPNGEFDISNKGRIGASEVELVQRMIDGVDKLIALEEEA